MYVCMFASIHVCTYVCINICMCVYMYICMNVCMYVCMYTCTYACMYACIYVYVGVFMNVCIYVCRRVCILVVSMCACIHYKMNTKHHNSILLASTLKKTYTVSSTHPRTNTNTRMLIHALIDTHTHTHTHTTIRCLILPRSLSAKNPYNQSLICRNKPAIYNIPWGFAPLYVFVLICTCVHLHCTLGQTDRQTDR